MRLLLLLPLVGKKIPAGVRRRLRSHRRHAVDNISEILDEIHAAEPAAAGERVEQRPALRTLVAPEEEGVASRQGDIPVEPLQSVRIQVASVRAEDGLDAVELIEEVSCHLVHRTLRRILVLRVHDRLQPFSLFYCSSQYEVENHMRLYQYLMDRIDLGVVSISFLGWGCKNSVCFPQLCSSVWTVASNVPINFWEIYWPRNVILTALQDRFVLLFVDIEFIW